MSLFRRFKRYLCDKILGENKIEDLKVKMETVNNRRVITIDSDNEEEPSWRGIRHEGVQSSDEIEETIISRSPNGPRSEDKGIDDNEDFYQPLSAMNIKEECTDECYDIDDYVYTQISFVDASDDESTTSPPHSPQKHLQKVKSEAMSFAEPSDAILSKQDVLLPEIYRGKPINGFENELPRVPEGTIQLEALEIKRESLENEWDTPRVQEELDMDSMRSICEETSLYPETTDLSMDHKSFEEENVTAEVTDSLRNSPGKGGKSCEVTDDAGDSFMDISTQSQVLDYEEKLTEDESEDESSSTDLDYHISEDLETDEKPERMEISSEDSLLGDAIASFKNITNISGDISGDKDDVIDDDRIQSLGENNCGRENSTEIMEMTTGEGSEEIDENYKINETIEISSRILTEEENGDTIVISPNEEISTATESGKTGNNSGETAGDDESVNESMDNDDVLSLTTTMSIQDEFPDDHSDFGDNSDENIDGAIPIAESTGINITDWILEGQKRRLEGSDDDVDVQLAAKVQRLDKTMEDVSFSSRIDPVEDANFAAKETSTIIPDLMSVDRSNTSYKLIPNRREDDASLYNREAEPVDVSIPHERSIYRAETFGLDIVVNTNEPGTSPSTSLIIPLDTPQEEDQRGTANDSKKPEEPARKYNLSASSSSSPEETPTRLSKSTKPLEDPPKTIDHDYTEPRKPKKKFRKSMFILKSKPPVVSSRESPAIESLNPMKNTQKLLRKTPPSSVEPLKPRNSPNALDHVFRRISHPQKRKNTSLTVLDSSEEENNVTIEKKTKKLKRKRKLYSRSDSIEDLSELRSDLDEESSRISPEFSDTSPKFINGLRKTKSPEKCPEIMETPRIIPVEHCKTPKNIVTTPRANNSVSEPSPQVERSKIFPVMGPEFDFLIQEIDSSLISTDTSINDFNISSGTPDTPVISTTGITDSVRMEGGPEESPEAENSSSSQEKTLEPSENAENNSPEDSSECVDVGVPNSVNSPEECPETPEDDDHSMDHTLTQLSHWTPLIPQKLIPLNSSPRISSNQDPDPSQPNQNVSVLPQKSLETLAPLDSEEDELMETVCPRPMIPEPLNDPQLTEDEKMPEDPIQEPKTIKKSPPTQSPEIQQSSHQESSLHQLLNPPELSLERISRPPPSPIHLSDDDSDTDTVIIPLQAQESLQEAHQLISSDEGTQNLTHISQLSQSPSISSINTPKSSKPSESRAESSKDTFKSPRTIETHDEDSGHGSEHSSIFRHPMNENLTPRNDLIDDEASDGASNCSESIETCSNSLDDLDYQNLDDGRSKHAFPGKLIKPKKNKKIKEPEPSTSSALPPPPSPADLSYLRFTNGKITKMQAEMSNKPGDESRMKAPKGMGVSLYDHQEHALAWMLWREECDLPGGILADDMGLGKTITTISLISESLKREPQIKNRSNKMKNKKPLGGTLIVCPANLITQWYDEFQERSDIDLVTKYHKEKASNPIYLSNSNVVITTYETLSRNFNNGKGVLFNIHWRRVVLDEAHVIRNPKSQKSLTIAELTTNKRWALTGTPVHNKIGDLYPVVRFLKLSPFDDQHVFTKWIDNGNENGIKRLKGLMDCIMLRRTKDGLITAGKMPQLPLKTKRTIDIVLSFDERLVYDRVMTHSKTLFIQFLHHREEKEREKAICGYKRTYNYHEHRLTKSQEEFLRRRGIIERHHILSLILRLRQICCHPSLIWQMLDKNDFKDAGIEEEENPGIQEILRQSSAHLNELAPEGNDDEIGVDERVVQDDQIMRSTNPVFSRDSESSKMKAVLEKVKEIIGNGEKVVIISDWVLYLQLIGEHLEKIPGADFKFYIGSGKQYARDQIVACFNNKTNPNILLLSLRAGGQGLNLTGANHVILVDVHWNPQLEIQAEDRIYRIGQTRDVFIHKFICKDTIEERIVALQERKLKLAQDVLSGTKGETPSLGVDELCSLFGM